MKIFEYNKNQITYTEISKQIDGKDIEKYYIIDLCNPNTFKIAKEYILSSINIFDEFQNDVLIEKYYESKKQNSKIRHNLVFKIPDNSIDIPVYSIM